MNFDELNQIVAKEAGVSICPICGTPFTPYHSRQKTCASEECRKAYRAEYLKERKERLMEEDIDLWRAKHAAAQRKCRHKKKRAKGLEVSYQELEDHWNGRANDNIYGLDYGKRQAEKTLASVPKIDVEGFLKERK